ncbi:MAG TPA: TonB family protein [Candidatus Acidoferrum sp.]
MGSAAEIKGGSAESRGVDEPVTASTGARGNPVAAEIPVNATGTRPSNGSDKRELFSEETETVLVFPDGAVIRLSAAVATGQLIFLTNKAKNIEVVCQVVGKRVDRPTSCYVELQFTEPMADFWGVVFPENSSVQTATTDVEAISTAEVTEDGAEVHAPPPSDEEVESLREEVEALRKQLQQLMQAEETAKAVAKLAEPAAGSAPMPVQVAPAAPVSPPAPVVASVPRVEEQVMSANEPAPTFPSASAPIVPPTVAAAASDQVPAAPWKSYGLSDDVAAANHQKTLHASSGRPGQVAMSLPNRDAAPKVDPEQEVIDQLLPQPALDFSKVPKQVHGTDPNDPYSIYKPAKAKMEKWLLVLLAVVLVGVVGGGVWKLGVIQNIGKRRLQKAAAGEQMKVVPAPVAAANGSGAANDTAAPDGNTAAIAPAVAVNPPLPNAKEKKGANAGDFHTAGPTPEAVSKEAERGADVGKRSTSAAAKGASKKKAAVTAAEPVEAPVEAAIPEDAPVVPAKLLKAVSPIYPPDAMRGFITGDVRLKAEVDETGKIRNMEVVSGPAALRPAAIEAMKQYEYAPATKGGKGIASQVKVTIKFWFDP